MAAYVQQLGQNLARHSELPDLAFTFTVLNSPVVNARALPGGYIYVTRGLLALASDEAELAGVLAHEIGHVTARHAAQRHSQSVAASVGTGLLGILIGNLADLAQLGAAAVLQSYSRDQEFKADELGVRYLTRAGYDPRAMASFLAKLLEDTRIAGEAAGRSGDPDRVDLFASHPRTLDRVERALAEATERPGTGARRNRHEYLGHIEGLIYGDDPKQGFVRGRVFAHPELRIRFEIPPGFRLHNTERQVQALGPDGAKITLSMARRNGGESARDFLLGVTARRLILNDVENLSIDGLDAATTTSSLRGSTGPMDVRLVNIRGDESVYYLFVFVTPPHTTSALADGLRRTTYSFQRLSLAEAARLQPRRIHVRRIGASDSADQLAAGFGDDIFRARRFADVNDVPPGTVPRTGELVKLVRE